MCVISVRTAWPSAVARNFVSCLLIVFQSELGRDGMVTGMGISFQYRLGMEMKFEIHGTGNCLMKFNFFQFSMRFVCIYTHTGLTAFFPELPG